MDTPNLCNKINEMIGFIKPFLPLVNCHLVNFITDNLFDKLIPKEIKEEVVAMKTDELKLLFLNNFKHCNNECRVSQLGTYFLKTKMMSLSHNGGCISLEKLKQILSNKSQDDFKSLPFQGFMSLKKGHEVEIMCALTTFIANNFKYSHIVDIGGGKGYLSSMLALEHNLKVLSIDSSIVNNQGAIKRTKKLEKAWKSIKNKFPQEDKGKNNIYEPIQSISLKQVTTFVNETTDLIQIVQRQYPHDTCDKVMMVGLHTCGTLSPSSLKLFVNNSKHINSLINVGCCYHLLEEEFEEVSKHWTREEIGVESFGFPMSNYLQEIKFSLGRNARMLAAQSIQRIANEKESNLDLLFHRVLLEEFLKSKMGYTSLCRFRVGRLAKKTTDFKDYFKKSIKKLELDEIKISDEELEQFYVSHLHERELFEKFFFIRVVLAPVVEGIILLDRQLYLHEQGIEESYIAQLFDPYVSPRCHAIIAFNNSK
uniref:Methyltransferase domain-containing protein n=2 Tax=Clastoptera arizonana TaxID=38151 RepID=A0A1B6E0U3_9HEMI